jgi:hypothetical protein
VIDTWTDSEKKIARRVYEAALAAELSEVISEVRARASRVQVPEDAWALEEFLRTRRIEIDQKYEYRYSRLVMLFGSLLLEGRIHDTDLDGLSDEKCRKIRLIEALARSCVCGDSQASTSPQRFVRGCRDLCRYLPACPGRDQLPPDVVSFLRAAA